MLCVNDVDVDGRLLRDDCAVREDGKSNAPKDVFNDEADVEPGKAAATDDDDAIGPNDADDNDDVPGVSGANADGFVRLFSNKSLPP